MGTDLGSADNGWAGWLKARRGRLAVFVLAPLLLEGWFCFAYFGPSDALRATVVPTVEGLQRDFWREIGALEIVQALILFACIAAAAVATFTVPDRLRRRAALILLPCILLVFLEEVEYFVPWYDLFTGHQRPEGERVTIHHQGDLNDVFRLVFNALVVLLFLVAPLVGPRLDSRVARTFAPGYCYLWAFALILAFSGLIHLLGEGFHESLLRETGRSSPERALQLARNPMLTNNLSEFKELGAYWFGCCYLIEVLHLRTAERRGGPDA